MPSFRNHGEIEVVVSLRFAGSLFDDRQFIPVLVRPMHDPTAQRAIVQRLNVAMLSYWLAVKCNRRGIDNPRLL